MTDQTTTLLAAASAASAAATDMIEAARDSEITRIGNVGSGETLTALVDSLRLLIEAMDTDDEDVTQMHGAAVRFLEDRQ